MQSPIYSALDSLSSPTIVPDGDGRSLGFRSLLDPGSPLPAMPLWQDDHDPFSLEAALADTSSSESPAGTNFSLGNLTVLEKQLEEPDDDATTLGALEEQIRATSELIELVREDARLTKLRGAQIQNRWECQGHLLLKLIAEYPEHFERPTTWDEDIDNLISRLHLENRTEEQLRDVLKIEEDCLRGGILAALHKSLQGHASALKSTSQTVTTLRSQCSAVQSKVQNANLLASRRNACVAIVNSLYQTMRQDEKTRSEIESGAKRLQDHRSAKDARDDIKGKYISTKAEIEREKNRLRDLISANKLLEEEINLKAADEGDAAENLSTTQDGKKESHAGTRSPQRRPFGRSPSTNWQLPADEERFC